MTAPIDDIPDIYGAAIPEELTITRTMYASLYTHTGANAQTGRQRAMLVAIQNLEAAIVELRDGKATTR